MPSAEQSGGCPTPDQREMLGALGVLSAEGREAFRGVLRATWFRPSRSNDFLLRFVMRTQSTRGTALHEEAYRHGDVLLVGSDTATRSVGPLHSLLGWWRCAVSSWPNAQLIGKADDVSSGDSN